MELDKLSALIESVKTGSINKASEKLGYTQSGLVYVINTVEKELGAKIIRRDHGGVALTNVGKAIFPTMEALVKSGNALQNHIDYLRNSTRQTIRVGIYSSLTLEWFPQIIRVYRTHHPNAAFDIRTGVMNLNRLLSESQIDIFIGESFLMPDAVWNPLGEDQMYAAIHRELPLANAPSITLEMLQDYLVIMPTLLSKNVVACALRRKNIHYPRQINLTTEDGSVTLKMVSQNTGVSFVSSLYSAECPPNVVLRPFSPPIIRKIGYAVRKDFPLSPAVSEFLHFLQCLYPESAQQSPLLQGLPGNQE